MARYSTTQGKWVRGNDLTPLTAITTTATGSSGWLSCEDFTNAQFNLNVTAIAGASAACDVAILTARDSSGSGSAAVTGSPFTQITTTTSATKVFSGFDDFYKVNYTCSGTVTFTVSGHSR